MCWSERRRSHSRVSDVAACGRTQLRRGMSYERRTVASADGPSRLKSAVCGAEAVSE